MAASKRPSKTSEAAKTSARKTSGGPSGKPKRVDPGDMAARKAAGAAALAEAMPFNRTKAGEYGDAAHKPTCIWGDFTVPAKRPVPRRKASTFRTKQENASPIDAITPAGFARAFYAVNP